MRKSTFAAAVIFLLCLLAVGAKYNFFQNTVSQLEETIFAAPKNALSAFLHFRMPQLSLKMEEQDRQYLVAAEQRAYRLKQENDSRKSAEDAETVQQEKMTEKPAEQAKESETEDVEEKGKKTISFPEYVQAAADSQIAYSYEQLTDFDFLISHFYQIHTSTTIYPGQLLAEEYLKTDLSIDRSKKGPQILIYHTHGSEYFKDSDKNNPDTLITGVGEVLKTTLEDVYGYQVYHDTTVFPYSSAYSRGRERVKELLEKYPGIQVIIDLHRDSSPNTHLVTEIDGKQTAQIMFFNGMSQTKTDSLPSRENKNLSGNLAFSLQLKLAAEQLYPGFARKNYLKAYRYNMDLAKRYALIEVGAETNTFEEEINAMAPLAEILHCVLQ